MSRKRLRLIFLFLKGEVIMKRFLALIMAIMLAFVPMVTTMTYAEELSDVDHVVIEVIEPTPEPTATPVPIEEPTPEPTEEPTPVVTEAPTEEPTATPEPTATQTPEPPPRSIKLSSSVDHKDSVYVGDEITLTLTLINFTGDEVYHVVWQCSKDEGETWEEIGTTTGLTFKFKIQKDDGNNWYRAVLFLD